MRIRNLLLASLVMVPLSASGAAYAHSDDNDDSKGGWACHHRHHEQDLWSKLPEAKRKLLKDAMKQAHKQNESLHEEAHKLHEKLEKAFTAPTLDKNAYRDAHAKLDALHDKMKANMEAAYLSAAAQFTADERKILEKMHEMHHDKGEWNHGEGHGDWKHDDKESNHTPQQN